MIDRWAAAVLVAVMSVAIATPAFGEAGSDAQTLVDRAAALNQKTLAGILVNDRSVDLRIVAGPVKQNEQNEATVINRDGEPSIIRYASIVKNRSELSSAELRERETKESEDLQSGKTLFRRPYDRRFEADYEFATVACPACRSGTLKVAFHSKVRDEMHGDGTMVIDDPSARVEAVTYEPNQMPPHATSGNVTESFGEPSAGLWTVVRIDRSYSGRIGFFRGGAEMTERLFNYRRYTTVAAALENCTHVTQK